MATIKWMVYERISLIGKYSAEQITAMSPMERVKAGLADPVRAFNKNEPHKLSKLFDEYGIRLPKPRVRVISNISMIDDLVGRMLFMEQNKEEIHRWWEHPSVPGIGFDDLNVEKFHKKVLEPMGDSLLLLDFKGWDWGVTKEMLVMESEIRSKLVDRRDGGLFLKRILLMAKSFFICSDGSCYSQVVEGIQKSGCYITSPGNSRMRALLSKLYAHRVEGREELDWPVAAMGDDSVEKNFEDPEKFVEWLKQYGLKPSADDFAVVSGDSVEFCSHKISLDEDGKPIAELLSIGKCFAKFLYNDDKTPEAIAGIRYAARYSPEINKLESYWYIFHHDVWVESYSVTADLIEF